MKILIFVVIAAALGGGAYWGYNALTKPAEQQVQSIVREASVSFGDIVVGVTESGTAAANYQYVNADFAAKVAEIAVRPGQEVKKGDLLFTLEIEDFEKQLSAYEMQYKQAKLSYDQAVVSQQLGQIDAKFEMDNAIIASQSASVLMDVANTELAASIEKQKSDIYDLQSEIDLYTRRLNAYDRKEKDLDQYYDDYLDAQRDQNIANEALNSFKLLKEEYDALVKALENAEKETVRDEEKIQAAKDDLAEFKNDNPVFASETSIASYQRQLNTAKNSTDSLVSELKSEYDDFKSDNSDILNSTQSELETKVRSLNESYSTAMRNLQKLQAEMSAKELAIKADYDQTLAQGKTAQTTYNLKLKQFANDVESKKLSLEELEEKINSLKKDRDAASFVAPCDGTVMSVSYREGDNVSQNQTVVAMCDNSVAYVSVSLSQEDVMDLILDQSATVLFDAYGSQTFDASVYSIATSPFRAASATVSYNVVVEIKAPAERILDGMSSTVTFVSKQVKEVAYITNTAVFMEDGREYVKQYDAEGNIVNIEIQTGFSDGRNVEVVKGLSAGDRILIESQVRV